uniref:Uncharacterized protein n=1 Tax=Manihot esculenta TaxID=3983 RepID=A0A2C9W4K7_MANES
MVSRIHGGISSRLIFFSTFRRLELLIFFFQIKTSYLVLGLDKVICKMKIDLSGVILMKNWIKHLNWIGSGGRRRDQFHTVTRSSNVSLCWLTNYKPLFGYRDGLIAGKEVVAHDGLTLVLRSRCLKDTIGVSLEALRGKPNENRCTYCTIARLAENS